MVPLFFRHPIVITTLPFNIKEKAKLSMLLSRFGENGFQVMRSGRKLNNLEKEQKKKFYQDTIKGISTGGTYFKNRQG